MPYFTYEKNESLAPIMTVAIFAIIAICVIYYWYNITIESIAHATENINYANNIKPAESAKEKSIDGQLNSLRESAKELQNKKDAEITKELK